MIPPPEKVRLILRVGIFGGTFDPIHLGHLRTAEEICQDLNLDKVYLIPSANPPHKDNEEVTPFNLRLEMARIAKGASSLLEVLDLEGKRSGFSYSIETLKEISAKLGEKAQLFFIIGEDAFLEIRTWKNYEALFEYAHFVIIRRKGTAEEKIEEIISGLGATVKGTDIYTMPSKKELIRVSTTQLDISATRIRIISRQGGSIRFLVTQGVLDYITEKGLYG